MKKEDKIEGQMGFDKEQEKEEIIDKDESLFKVDGDGNAIPEKYPILFYDRTIDSELIEEGLLLLNRIKKQKAINNVIIELIEKDRKGIQDLNDKMVKEVDEKKKKELQIQLVKARSTDEAQQIQTKINANVIDEEILESRGMIRELKEVKEKQQINKFVELAPCTTAEAFLSFEKGKTIEGKDTNDWVADLISKKCFNPKYTFEEAKRLKPDYKIAIKEGIMEASNYKVKNYREIMMEQKLAEENPKTKKESPMREKKQTPSLSADCLA